MAKTYNFTLNNNSLINERSMDIDYYASKLLTINNFPLLNPEDVIINTTPDGINPNQAAIDQNITNKLAVTTYEMLYRNILSYPYDIDMTDKKYIIKTYYIDDILKMIITTDTRTPNIIISTISGDTPTATPLIKTTTISADFTKMSITYS